MAKPLKYTEKVAVAFTSEQLRELKQIAEQSGESVSGILRRLGLQYIAERKKK